jgi:hypothetical protein
MRAGRIVQEFKRRDMSETTLNAELVGAARSPANAKG